MKIRLATWQSQKVSADLVQCLTHHKVSYEPGHMVSDRSAEVDSEH